MDRTSCDLPPYPAALAASMKVVPLTSVFSSSNCADMAPAMPRLQDKVAQHFQAMYKRQLLLAVNTTITEGLEWFVGHLPMHPNPKRVGSSEVNIIASMGCFGWKPASLRARRAAMAPTTPSVPSYMPARGMASVCEPVTIAPA